MFPLILLITVTGLILWAIWWVIRPRAAFVVQIERGLPRAVQGTVTPAFLQEVREVCGRHGVQDGFVRGVASDRRIRLEFSAGMPATCQQQLRNLWSLSGWSAE
jgi:hypothetical protein